MRKSSKFLWRVAWSIFSFAILYVTFYPFAFHFDMAYLGSRLPQIDWYPILPPPKPWVNWPDMVNNVILFLPFGFLGYWSVGTPTRHKRVILVLLGFLFSLGIESMQLFTGARDTQLIDVLTNTLGTALGVWLATLASLG